METRTLAQGCGFPKGLALYIFIYSIIISFICSSRHTSPWLYVTHANSTTMLNHHTAWHNTTSSCHQSNINRAKTTKYVKCREKERRCEGNRPKQCQMRCLGPRWVSFFFLRVFHNNDCYFIVYISCNLWNTGHEGSWKVTTTQTGPNNSRRIVWALGELFFFSLCVFLNNNCYFIVYIGCNIRNTMQQGSRKVTTTQKGPNDSRRIVWALRERVFFFFVFFPIIIFLLLIYGL